MSHLTAAGCKIPGSRFRTKICHNCISDLWGPSTNLRFVQTQLNLRNLKEEKTAIGRGVGRLSLRFPTSSSRLRSVLICIHVCIYIYIYICFIDLSYGEGLAECDWKPHRFWECRKPSLGEKGRRVVREGFEDLAAALAALCRAKGPRLMSAGSWRFWRGSKSERVGRRELGCPEKMRRESGLTQVLRLFSRGENLERIAPYHRWNRNPRPQPQKYSNLVSLIECSQYCICLNWLSGALVGVGVSDFIGHPTVNPLQAPDVNPFLQSSVCLPSHRGGHTYGYGDVCGCMCRYGYNYTCSYIYILIYMHVYQYVYVYVYASSYYYCYSAKQVEEEE